MGQSKQIDVAYHLYSIHSPLCMITNKYICDNVCPRSMVSTCTLATKTGCYGIAENYLIVA